MNGTSFDSTRTPLQEQLTGADKGLLQPSDFPRKWGRDDRPIWTSH